MKKKYIHYDREKTLEDLKPYFLLGMSIDKACQTSGILDGDTVYRWCKDFEVRKRVEAWQNYVSSKAREVWANEVNEKKNYTASKEWLERKEKGEFAPRSEVTGPEGQAQVLTIDIIEDLFGKQVRKD